MVTVSVLGISRMARRAAAQDAPVRAAIVETLMAGADDEAKYVGSKKCKKCHIKQHKSWAKTKMGKAFDTLKPGVAAEIKTKSGLDPNKDYTQDAKCLECHTVGFGKPGGYTIPDPNNKKAVRKAKALRGVGCEMCHGPGSGYIKLHEEILKSGRKYTQAEMLAAGLKLPDEASCMKCHDGRGPTTPAEPFNFETMKEKGTHEHIPLKWRSDS